MIYYPVIIPTLNRYEHLKKCIDSLSKNTLASETELIIGFDYPPAEKYIEGYKKIKEYIPTITGFKSVTCLERTENLGASKNSLDLEDYVLSKYDAYIYSEDDNIFSPYFLQFMNEGLEKYKDNDTVFAICGYSYPIDWKTDKDCILQHQYFSAWGYGIWKDREDVFKQSISDSFFEKRFYRNKSLKSKLRKTPSNFINFMGYAFVEKIPVYDISRSFYMYLNSLNVLMPVKTLVTNDGWDGSGEHFAKSRLVDFRNVQRNDNTSINVKSVEPVFSVELERIVYSLKSRFSLFEAKIKYLLIKVFGTSVTKKIVQCLKGNIKK